MNFVVFVEIVVIFLPCPSMSGCKNVTRAPNSSLAPVSKTGLPGGAAVIIAIGGHRVKIVAISDCPTITHDFLLDLLSKRSVTIKLLQSK